MGGVEKKESKKERERERDDNEMKEVDKKGK